MKMFNKIVYSVLLTCLTMGLFAQRDMHRMPRGEGQIMKDLDLRDDQKTQIQDIMKSFKDDMKVLLNKEDITVGEQRKQMSMLVADRDKKIMAILDDTQRKKFEESMKNRPTPEEMQADREELHAKRDSLRAEMMSIKTDPNLTEEQRREKLRQFREEQGQSLNRNRDYRGQNMKTRGPELGDRQRAVPNAERVNLMDELDLSMEQKLQIENIQESHRLTVNKIRNSDATKEAKRTQILEEAEKMKEEISGVLTKEQLEKWKKIRPRRQER